MIIGPDDLKTHMYPEVQQIITRTDDNIAVEAIKTAIDEVKMYLSRYDLVALFGDDDATPQVAATFTSPALTNMVKNIAVWQLIRLANPNVEMAVARTAYEDAVRQLRDIQKGAAEPAGWPYAVIDNTGVEPGDTIQVSSNHKRKYYF